MKKKALALVLSLTLGATMLVGCGSSSSDSADSSTEETTDDAAEAEDTADADATTSEGGLKFGYTYWAASDFFSTIGDTLAEVAAANGDEVISKDAQQDQATQISIIEDFITQGVAAVFLNPVDAEGVEPAVELLNEAGIPIINIDTAVANLDEVDSFVASDNYGAGVQCAEKLLELIPDGGEIAILDYPANNACVDRVNGFTATLEASDVEFTVVAQQDAEGKPDPGLEKTADILQANPDIVAVFACNDQCGQGAYAAINDAGSSAIVLGVDGSPEGKEYISEGGAFVATAAQSPIQMATQAMETAYAILNGEDYETNIAVETFIIDASNVADYMDGWQ